MANHKPVCKFAKGNKLGGRTPKIALIQEFCRKQGESILLELVNMFESKKTGSHTKIRIAEILLAYGYGKPSQNIELTKGKGEGISLKFEMVDSGLDADCDLTKIPKRELQTVKRILKKYPKTD